MKIEQLNVMLIDDDRATNFLNQIILKESGVIKLPEIFINGNDSLSALSQRMVQNETLPDLILLDLNMPGMDGWEFLTLYHKQIVNYNGRQPIIIILSTSQNPSDLKKAAESPHVSHYLEKPLIPEKINDCIQKYFS